MKVGFLRSLIRPEEKMLLKEFKSRNNVEIIDIDDRELIFNLGEDKFDMDVLLERCINHNRALHSILMFESAGIKCINNSKVATICGDKLLTSRALEQHKVPQPDVKIAFTQKSALKAIEDMGYPAVLKPAVGSWGRLISKVSDADAAEAILEHKTILGSYHHSLFYIQKYVEKQERDIRSFVVGDECIGAIYRSSSHWKTNTATGGKASNCPVSDEIREMSLKAAEAVGGGVVAVDLFEDDDNILVNEVNYTMEFRNSIKTTGVNIPEKIVDYVVEEGRK